MSNPNELRSRLQQIFEAEEDVLRAKIKRAEQFDHGTLKGSTVEYVARNFLRRYLPPLYGFGNGQIIDSNGEISKEVDIAICNPSHPFTYEQESRGLFFIESVDAVIEVKSSANDINDLVQHCKSVRKLEPEYDQWDTKIKIHDWDRIERTPYAVFAFGSDKRLETIVDQLERSESTEPESIDLIYVLDRGLIVYDRPLDINAKDTVSVSSNTSGGYAIIDDESALPMFLLLLSDKMPEIYAPENPVANYFRENGE